LLPTPNPFHLKNDETPEVWAARRAEVKTRTKTNLGMPLPVAVQLLPTPTAQDGANNAGPSQSRRHTLPLNTAVTHLGVRDELEPAGEQLAIPMPGDPSMDWGPYTPAIVRWAHVIGRPPPDPMVDGKLSPLFTEWLMGLPEGWVTGFGIARNPLNKMLGNGVVPQQAAAALVHLGIRDAFR
jgi:DNA (cytosine-5)-methyltransferase 1